MADFAKLRKKGSAEPRSKEPVTNKIPSIKENTVKSGSVRLYSRNESKIEEYKEEKYYTLNSVNR